MKDETNNLDFIKLWLILISNVTLSGNYKVAVKRILVGKYGTCAGQACIAIDYVIVEKSCCSKLVHLVNSSIQVHYYVSF